MDTVRSRRLPLLLLALCLLTSMGLALLSLPAGAAQGSGCQTTGGVTIYYNNAGHTHEVGRYTSSCQGVCTGSGAITPYYDVMNFVCPPPPTEP